MTVFTEEHLVGLLDQLMEIGVSKTPERDVPTLLDLIRRGLSGEEFEWVPDRARSDQDATAYSDAHELVASSLPMRDPEYVLELVDALEAQYNA